MVSGVLDPRFPLTTQSARIDPAAGEVSTLGSLPEGHWKWHGGYAWIMGPTQEPQQPLRTGPEFTWGSQLFSYVPRYEIKVFVCTYVYTYAYICIDIYICIYVFVFPYCRTLGRSGQIEGMFFWELPRAPRQGSGVCSTPPMMTATISYLGVVATNREGSVMIL